MQNRESIIQATTEMVLRGNVDTISMSKIAKEAGVGKSTIYEYFSNKEELMLMVAKSLIKKYVDMILACQEGANTYETFYNHMIVALRIGKQVFQLFDMTRQNSISYFASNEIKEIGMKGLNEVLRRFDDIYFKAKEEGLVKPKRDMKSQRYIVYGLLKGSFLCNIGMYAVSDEQFIKDVYENILIILNN